MRVLVTGGTGFIGAALVQRLRGEPRRVVHAPSSAELDLLRELPDGLPEVDVLVHCAASRDRNGEELARYVEETRLNVDAVARLYDWAVRRGVRQVVHVSTISVVTPAAFDGVLDEASSRVEPPAHPYALTKRMGEDLAVAMRPGFASLDVVRPGPVYGPGQPRRGTIATLAERARRGSKETFTLDGADGWRMSPVFVDDVVDVLAFLLDAPQNDVLTVGGPDAKSERELIADLADHFASRPAIAAGPGTPRSIVASTAKADAAFPGRQRTGWRDGVRRTWG